MTAAELIERLKLVPADAPVMIEDDDHGVLLVDEVRIGSAFGVHGSFGPGAILDGTPLESGHDLYQGSRRVIDVDFDRHWPYEPPRGRPES